MYILQLDIMAGSVVLCWDLTLTISDNFKIFLFKNEGA